MREGEEVEIFENGVEEYWSVFWKEFKRSGVVGSLYEWRDMNSFVKSAIPANSSQIRQLETDLNARLSDLRDWKSKDLLKYKALEERSVLIASHVNENSKAVSENLKQFQPIFDLINPELKVYREYQSVLNYLKVLKCLLGKVLLVNATAAQGAKKTLIAIEELKKYVQVVKEQGATQTLLRECDHQINHLELMLGCRFVRNFQAVLQSLGWPGVITEASMSTKNSVLLKRSAEDLIVWQNSQAKTERLLLISSMLEPLCAKFRYHFEGSRPTNRQDKPEWMFSHVLNVIRQYRDFLLDHIQVILNDLNLSFTDAKDQFIAGWVEEVGGKLSRDIDLLVSNPVLLSHCVHECLLFESTLLSEFDYDIDAYGNMSNVFLQDEFVFQTWLNLESQNAENNYKAFMEDQNAWNWIEEDFSSTEKSSTVSARNLLVLLSAVSERYCLIRSPNKAIFFFEVIQKEIASAYFKEIKKKLQELREAFFEDILERTDTICRYWSSANSVKIAFQEWADNELFVRLSELNQAQEKDYSCWDELIEECEAFEDDCLNFHTQLMLDEFSNLTRSWRRKRHTTISYYSNQLAEIEFSPEYLSGLTFIKNQLNLSRKTLVPASFDAAWKHSAFSIDNYMLERIILSQQYDKFFIGEFARDLEALHLVFQSWTKKPNSYFTKSNNALDLMKFMLKSDAEHQDQDIALLSEEDVDDFLAKSILNKHNLYGLSTEQAKTIAQLYVTNDSE